MRVKLQEGEQILFEGKPENRIFIMWIFTKIIPYCILAGIITFYVFLLHWVFFIVIPLKLRNPFFPFTLSSQLLSLLLVGL